MWPFFRDLLRSLAAEFLCYWLLSFPVISAFVGYCRVRHFHFASIDYRCGDFFLSICVHVSLWFCFIFFPSVFVRWHGRREKGVVSACLFCSPSSGDSPSAFIHRLRPTLSFLLRSSAACGFTTTAVHEMSTPSASHVSMANV